MLARLIVGETGSEQGHVVEESERLGDMSVAALHREGRTAAAEYGADGWYQVRTVDTLEILAEGGRVKL